MKPKLQSAWRKMQREAHRRRVVMGRVRLHVRAGTALPPPDSASAAGLRYVDNERTPGIRRVGPRRQFRYVAPTGREVRDPAQLQRIRSLVIPPAWTDVWICPDPRGHLQAVGRDARGRKQYRYHPRWREVRDEVKYGKMLVFGRVLPAIREQVKHELALPGLPKRKVQAAIVTLLEKT